MSDEWQVRPERSGWRDLEFSNRHRTMYGWNCPMVDIDFLCTEYDAAKPHAIVEYKHEMARPIEKGHPSFRTLAYLADGRNLPFFCIRYAQDYTWFEVEPINANAEKYIPLKRRMSEYEYVELLYKVRGRKLPPSIAMKLKT